MIQELVPVEEPKPFKWTRKSVIPESLSTKHTKLSLGRERRQLEANLYNSVNMRAIPMRVQADKAEVKEALSKENRSDSMAGTA